MLVEVLGAQPLPARLCGEVLHNVLVIKAVGGKGTYKGFGEIAFKASGITK